MSKKILITGASSGIGKETANFFYHKGYGVIGLSRKKPDDANYPYYECDLSNKDSIIETVKRIKKDNKHIDVLINCAGVGTGGAVEDISYDHLKWVFDVNVLGLTELTNQLIPLLRESDAGKIINLSSVAGEITIPYQVSYSMTKAAIIKLSEGLKIELKPFGIDVCSVLPGDTKTHFTQNRVTVIPKNSQYEAKVKRSIGKMEKDEMNGVSPMKVVKVLDKLIKKKRMPVRVTVGFNYKFLIFLSKVLPKRLVAFIVTKLYG